MIHIELPPLRERKGDIPVLVRSFLDEMSRRWYPGENRNFDVTEEAMERLGSYTWPGNVRELRNTVERVGQQTDSRIILRLDFGG